ncbi:MAG: hypothetical protein ABJB12_19930 [Pseudomonadota bacterium]
MSSLQARSLWRTAVALLAFAVALGACSNDFEPQSRVDTLRVLAVRPEPASGTPGQTTALDLVIADGASGSAHGVPARPLQVAWLAGCHNPPTRQYFGCLPILRELGKRLSPRAVATPASSLPPSVFGTGTHYDLAVPEDILSAAPEQAGDPVHFGVSFAFFAVCAGELRPLPDATDGVPLSCVDPETGAALGRKDFVTGFSTLYTYKGAVNQNPVLSGVHLGQTALDTRACQSDEDCAGLVDPAQAGFDERCGGQGTCAPVLPACKAASECVKILIAPDVDPASAERLPSVGANEILWANFYASAGSFQEATELVNDRSTGFIADHGSYFRPPPHSDVPTTVWLTVNDERGGAAFQSFEVWTKAQE